MKQHNNRKFDKLSYKRNDNVDRSSLSDYEKEDMTENTKELACVAGACEIL